MEYGPKKPFPYPVRIFSKASSLSDRVTRPPGLYRLIRLVPSYCRRQDYSFYLL